MPASSLLISLWLLLRPSLARLLDTNGGCDAACGDAGLMSCLLAVRAACASAS